MATAAFVSIGLLFISPAAAQVDNTVESYPTELQDVYGTLLNYDVDADVALALIDKTQRGIALDSMTMPQSASVQDDYSQGETATVYRFPDGSIEVLSLEPIPDGGGIGPQDIQNCITSGTPGAQSNCRVGYWSPTVAMSFTRILRLNVGGNSAWDTAHGI